MSSLSLIDVIIKGPSHIALKASISGENLKVPNLQTGDFGVYSCSQKEYTVQLLSGERWLLFLMYAFIYLFLELL